MEPSLSYDEHAVMLLDKTCEHGYLQCAVCQAVVDRRRAFESFVLNLCPVPIGNLVPRVHWSALQNRVQISLSYGGLTTATSYMPYDPDKELPCQERDILMRWARVMLQSCRLLDDVEHGLALAVKVVDRRITALEPPQPDDDDDIPL